MSIPSQPDASSVYDADLDLTSEAASIKTSKNSPKHPISRRETSGATCFEAVATHSTPPAPALQAQHQAKMHLHEPNVEAASPKNPRRYGKADWRRDVSSALFSASGRRYGLGDPQRGYLSNTYVTHLTYPESITEQQSESRKLRFARHFKCWQRQGAISFAAMPASPAPSIHIDETCTEDASCERSVVSADLTYQTDFTSPSRSHRRCRTSPETGVPDLYDPNHASQYSGYWTSEVHHSAIHGGTYKQDDVVGQYLAQRDAHTVEGQQAPLLPYVNEYMAQGHQAGFSGDSYAHDNAQRWYPDPETIRHLHTLHSLLPHIQPERKLNALSGLEIDIIDGNTNQVFCRAVSKKLLVLFLGREVVSKFIRTFAREDTSAWRGPATEQKLVLPSKVASAAAIRILVSWMERACRFATMRSMKPLRIPNNLFVACSLARTLELFKLHKDAYRLDVAISQQFASTRPIFAVEIETMWVCLGEGDKYVYACVRALSRRMSNPEVALDLQGLAENHPGLYARLCDPQLNELYRPQFGRDWFGKLPHHSDQGLYADRSWAGVENSACPARSSLVPHTQSTKSLDPSAPAFRPTCI